MPVGFNWYLRPVSISPSIVFLQVLWHFRQLVTCGYKSPRDDTTSLSVLVAVTLCFFARCFAILLDVFDYLSAGHVSPVSTTEMSSIESRFAWHHAALRELLVSHMPNAVYVKTVNLPSPWPSWSARYLFLPSMPQVRMRHQDDGCPCTYPQGDKPTLSGSQEPLGIPPEGI